MGIAGLPAPRRERDGHRGMNAASHGAMVLTAVVHDAQAV